MISFYFKCEALHEMSFDSCSYKQFFREYSKLGEEEENLEATVMLEPKKLVGL